MPPKFVFLPFYGFICDKLERPSVKSPKVFTAPRIQWYMNFKHENVGFVKARFSIFAKLRLLKLRIKLVL